jgi:phosphatidylglycerophosphate synthase
LADWPITPNQMTAITILLAFIVSGLFLLGWLWPAVLLAFVVDVLDGVDGKLARAKALATRLGQLEHSFDLLYEQSWYIAYTWAAYRLWPSVLRSGGDGTTCCDHRYRVRLACWFAFTAGRSGDCRASNVGGRNGLSP